METLVNEPFFTAVPEFLGMTLDKLLQVKHPTSWIEFEKGTISEEEYLRTFFRSGEPIDGAGLRHCLASAYRWLDGMESLLADLNQAGYSLHALSNYSLWYRIIEERLKLSRYLEWTFVSCQTGVRKPDRAAYLGAAERLRVAPVDCLFIDDRPVNVDAARAVGMNAILREGAPQVRRELQQRQLL